MAPSTVPPHDADLESFVEAFEAARALDEEVDLPRFLPEPGHPLFAAVLRELVRVDLEHGWQRGRPRRVADYVQLFPDYLRQPTAIQEIAFEEYRLRLQAGENPSAAEYRREFQVDVLDWPQSESSEWGLARKTLALTPLPDQDLDGRPRSIDERSPVGERKEWFRDLRRSDPQTAHRLLKALDELPAPGTDFLGFRLLAELGRGAYGCVFLARQESLAGRPVALKVAADVWGESQNLAQLQHTNIVPVYSVHRTGLLQAVCMPYLGSTTLADVIADLQGRQRLPASGKDLVESLAAGRRDTQVESRPPSAGLAKGMGPNGPPPEIRSVPSGAETVVLEKLEGLTYVNAVLWIVSRLADGLAHAHERGILHRDLKPANVLLTDEGQPMLLDFNLSADTKQATAARLGGTLPYLAPEHLDAFLNGKRPVDQRSDVYSLGVLLYELLTRRHPFPIHRDSPQVVLPRMIRERLRPLPRVRPWNPLVSPAVESIVRHCLEPDPQRRYQTASQLREDLQRHLDDLPLRHAGETSLRERMGKWVRRHPWATSSTSIGVAALLLVLALGCLCWWRGQRLAGLEARESLRQFREEALAVRSASIIPDPTPQELADADRLGRQALGRYGILVAGSSLADFSPHLSAVDRERLHGEIGELLFMLARNTRLRAETGGESTRRGELLEQALEMNRLAETTRDRDDLARALQQQRSSLLEASGRRDEANALRQEAERWPLRTATDRLLVALEHRVRGEQRQANSLLKEASRQDPTNPLVWSALGDYYATAGQGDRAADHYSTAIALQPGFYRTYHLRGRAHQQRKDQEQALADFDEALRLRPGFVPAYLDRAVARFERKDLRGALQDLDRAVETDASHTRVFLMRSRIRQLLGDAEGARSDWEEGLRREPADEQSWLARGFARVGRDSAGALADFEAGLKANPRSRVALINLAHVLAERLGRTEEAVKALDDVVAFYPDFVSGRASRGVLLARLGKRDAALEDAREALLRDTSPAIAYQVAGIYALTSRHNPEDLAEACRLLGSALRRGYGHDLLATDHDLDPIRVQPAFQKMLEAARTFQAGTTSVTGAPK